LSYSEGTYEDILHAVDMASHNAHNPKKAELYNFKKDAAENIIQSGA
jgi:hypothetical protein